MRSNVCFALTLLTMLCGCDARLASSLSEAEANEVVAALDTHGIGAEKSASSGSGEAAGFDVAVSRGDLAEALSVLTSRGLPRREEPGIAETYREPSLVPTPTEERARYLSALGGEIARSLERVEGVVDARVHVAVPDTSDMPLDAPPPSPRASVLISTTSRARITDAEVVRLVGGSIEGIDANAIAVVRVRVSEPSQRSHLANVGPFRVAAGSASVLRIALVASLAVHALMAAALFVVARRTRPIVTDAVETT